MKRFVLVVLVLAAVIYLGGCGKKEQSLTEMEEPISIEELGKLDTQAVMPETTVKAEPMAAAPSAEIQLLATPYRPAVEEIQAALKNAGYYTGLIDAKLGPLTKKAIEDFQRANNLQADGKVGPKTWAILSKYLNPAAAIPTTTQKNR